MEKFNFKPAPEEPLDIPEPDVLEIANDPNHLNHIPSEPTPKKDPQNSDEHFS